MTGSKTNPARPAKRHKRAARALVKRYGGKRRARQVAGGMIGVAKSRRQKEHFVRVRRAMNPRKLHRVAWTGGSPPPNRLPPEAVKLARLLYKEQMAEWKRYWGDKPNADTRRIFQGRARADAWATYRDKYGETSSRRKNPVRITKGGSRAEYHLYTRSPSSAKWSLTVKTNNIGKLLKTAVKMRDKGYGIKVGRVK